MSRESWIPFPDVSERTGGEITLGNTALPVGFDEERLELNVGALRSSVIGFGGFEQMKLGGYSGETDSYSVGVGGTDRAGNAFAQLASVKSRAKSSRRNSETDFSLSRQDLRNGSLDIEWNGAALTDRLEGAERFSPKLRAEQLDAVIRKETVAGVWRHNIADPLSRGVVSPILLVTDVLHYMNVADVVTSGKTNGDMVFQASARLGVAGLAKLNALAKNR
jgi:hypothetical protein